MGSRLRRLTMLLAVCVQGCAGCPFGPSPSPSPSPCAGGGGFAGGPREPGASEPLGLPGLAFQTTAELDLGFGCSGAPADVVVTSVTAEVTDPDNLRVAVTASPPARLGSGQWQTRLEFTPTRAGPYHLLVTFEPGLGLVQRDVWVVNDARGAVPRVARTPSADCEHLELTARGGVVCKSTFGGGTRLFRDGAQVAYWPGDEAHAVGNVIWVAGFGGTLTRSLDTGAGPPQLTASGGDSPGVTTFSVTEDEVLAWGYPSLDRYHFDGAALQRLSRTGVQEGVGVAVALDADGGTALFADPQRWARMNLVGPPQSPNWQDAQPVTHQDADGLWVAVDAVTTRFVPADPARPMATFAPPAGWVTSLDRLNGGGAPALTVGPGSRPIFYPVTAGLGLDTTRALVATVHGADVQLNLFQAPPDAGFVEVTGDWLRASAGDTHSLFAVPR